MKLSLVVPCYNEEGNVEKFYEEVKKAFTGKVEDYEFVFVNDGSKDNTYPLLKSFMSSTGNPKSRCSPSAAISARRQQFMRGLIMLRAMLCAL